MTVFDILQTELRAIDTRDRWPSVVAAAAMLRASNALSNQRSIGAAFYENCNVSSVDLARFAQFQGGSDALMQLAVNFDPQVATLMRQRTANADLVANITALSSVLYDSNFVSACTQTDARQRDQPVCAIRPGAALSNWMPWSGRRWNDMASCSQQRDQLTNTWSAVMQNYIMNIVDDIRTNTVVSGIVQVGLR